LAGRHTLASVLDQVKPLDAASYIAAVLCLVLVSLAASAVPAQRAARLDPAKALRAE
jgi:ABC-type antimicrobial peptide transport system permease subunit